MAPFSLGKESTSHVALPNSWRNPTPVSIRFQRVEVNTNIWPGCLTPAYPHTRLFPARVHSSGNILFIPPSARQYGLWSIDEHWTPSSNLSWVSEQLCPRKHSFCSDRVINNAHLSFFGVRTFITSPMSKD